MPDINEILSRPYNRASSSYGASMGRSQEIPDDAKPEPLYLQVVEFEDGDYDSGGAYWGGGCWGGNGAAVWCAYSLPEETVNDSPVMVFVRGWDRDDAQAEVRELLGEEWDNFKE